MNAAPQPVDPAPHDRHGAHTPYLRAWGALAVLTLVEYVYASYFRELFGVLVIGLLFWAAVKAGLVGWFFMHLKHEGAWVYLVIAPACLLAVVLVLALYPDLAMKPVIDENPVQESSGLETVPGTVFWAGHLPCPSRCPENGSWHRFQAVSPHQVKNQPC